MSEALKFLEALQRISRRTDATQRGSSRFPDLELQGLCWVCAGCMMLAHSAGAGRALLAQSLLEPEGAL